MKDVETVNCFYKFWVECYRKISELKRSLLFNSMWRVRTKNNPSVWKINILRLISKYFPLLPLLLRNGTRRYRPCKMSLIYSKKLQYIESNIKKNWWSYMKRLGKESTTSVFQVKIKLMEISTSGQNRWMGTLRTSHPKTEQNAWNKGFPDTRHQGNQENHLEEVGNEIGAPCIVPADWLWLLPEHSMRRRSQAEPQGSLDWGNRAENSGKSRWQEFAGQDLERRELLRGNSKDLWRVPQEFRGI